MSTGYWILSGAFGGGICGALFGSANVLVHFHHYPYPSRHDFYPLPIALGNVATGYGLMAGFFGAVIGFGIGIKQGSAHTPYHTVDSKIEDDNDVWPPAPKI